MNESAGDPWPRCAACGRRRLTLCPACGEAGTCFPPAPQVVPSALPRATRTAGQPGATGHAGDHDRHHHLLVCRQCDHVFAPQYYRYCAWCGQDAGSGLEVGGGPRTRLAPLGLGMVLATCGLLLLVLWYFHWICRQ